MSYSNGDESLLTHEHGGYGSAAVAPLKNDSSRKKRGLYYRYCIVALASTLLAVIAFSIISAVVVIPHAQEYVNQSVEVDIRHVELDSITKNGVNVRVEGINTVNYDGIESGFASSLFRLSGGLMRSALIEMNSVELQTMINVGDGKQELVSIGKVDVPDFKVNIGDGQITIFSLLVSIQPNTAKILGLIKDLLQHPDKIFKVYGSTMLKVTLGGGIIPISGIKIDFEHDIIGENYFQLRGDELKIDNLLVNETDSAYDIQFGLSLPNPIHNKLFAFQVPSLGWEIFIQDCYNKSVISFFDHDVITEEFRISTSDEVLNVGIRTSISELNPSLSDQCYINDVNLTPMNILIDQFMNNKTLPVMVRNSKGSPEYPSFINEILSHLEFKIDYYSNFEISRLLDSVSLDFLKFEFQNGNINKPIINGEINMVINMPLNSSTSNLRNLEISEIRASQNSDSSTIPIKLFHQDKEFGEVNFIDWHDCENQLIDDKLFVKFLLNQEELAITDKTVFGKVVNDVFKNGKSSIFIDAIMDCLVHTLIGDFQVNGISVNSESEITRGEGIMAEL
jgi:hypothetical protein